MHIKKKGRGGTTGQKKTHSDYQKDKQKSLSHYRFTGLIPGIVRKFQESYMFEKKRHLILT